MSSNQSNELSEQEIAWNEAFLAAKELNRVDVLRRVEEALPKLGKYTKSLKGKVYRDVRGTFDVVVTFQVFV